MGMKRLDAVGVLLWVLGRDRAPWTREPGRLAGTVAHSAASCADAK